VILLLCVQFRGITSKSSCYDGNVFKPHTMDCLGRTATVTFLRRTELACTYVDTTTSGRGCDSGCMVLPTMSRRRIDAWHVSRTMLQPHRFRRYARGPCGRANHLQCDHSSTPLPGLWRPVATYALTSPNLASEPETCSHRLYTGSKEAQSERDVPADIYAWCPCEMFETLLSS
jgi:hypothetical protein